MKIAVAGAGYVGLVTSVCLADMGHHVTCIDIDDERIDLLQKGHSPIYEPGLARLLGKKQKAGQLFFTTDPHIAYPDADIIFIAVGTPEKHDGSVDLKYIYVAAYTIAHHIENDVIICTKSTVPIGTNDLIKQIMNSRKPIDLNVKVVSNPEFLREGSAISDFYHADRIVIGTDDSEAASIMEQLYLPLKIPIMKTDIKSAEMIKYAANAFLATKISFINEIASICEKVGANIEEVAYGIGQDKRIGPNFLKAGIGFGGSCFPKDTKALVQLAGNVKHHFKILEAAIKVNDYQKSYLVLKAKEMLGFMRNKRVAVLGLAFKPDTDDIREAASLTIIHELIKEQALVTAYDPVAVANVRKLFGSTIKYTANIREALQDADLAIIATEWEQIKHLPLEDYVSYMKDSIVIDGRNCYSLAEIKKHPITYISIGRPVIMKEMKKELRS
jgi:UDPglucose 6-dehydrogenase